MADDTVTTEPGPGPGQDPVSTRMILLLALYLVVLAIGLMYGIYNRWPACASVCTNQPTSAQQQTAQQQTGQQQTGQQQPGQEQAGQQQAGQQQAGQQQAGQQQAGQQQAGQQQAGQQQAGQQQQGQQQQGRQQPTQPQAPVIEAVSPKTVLIGCDIQVTIKGRNFTKDGATVTFGGVPATGKVDPNGVSINVQPPAHAEGDVDLVVKNGDGTTSDIAKNAFTYTCPPLPDTRLLLLVIFAGALGGTLHGLRSLYWYVGLRSLLKSWILMYLLLPFTGAIVSVIFFSVIRAGLVPAPTSKDASVAVIAIAVLVGLFSQQAAVKLKDIFEAILAKPQTGPVAESKPQGSVPPGGSPESKPGQGGPKPTFDKAQGKAGDTIKLTGTGMKTVDSVMFGPVPLAKTQFSITPQDGTITMTVPALPLTSPPTGPRVNVVVKGDTTTLTVPFTYQP